MLGLAALILAAASADASLALTSPTPWWEKVTYTISGKGEQQSCEYQSSIAGPRSCDPDEASSPMTAASASNGTFMKITIERRFTPGNELTPVSLEAGDTLLGGQIMKLAIDGSGTVRGCEVLAASGEVRPAYGCEAARAEFEAGAGQAAAQVQQAYMTIIVYGHEEYLV